MEVINTRKINIGNIPAILWGESSDKIYIFVHGKMLLLILIIEKRICHKSFKYGS